MPSMIRKLLPATRLGLVLWAWRNRVSMLDWLTFALRAAQSAATGRGMADAKAEFRLRAHLARSSTTRNALVDVKVEDGVAVLEGRMTPEVHAAVQDMAVATPGVASLDDRITHSLAKGGLLGRKAKTAPA